MEPSSIENRNTFSESRLRPSVTEGITAATAALFVTAILGPALPIATVDGLSIFAFRVYLPIYGLVLVSLVATHRLSFSRRVAEAVPTAVWLLGGMGGYAAISAVFYTDVHQMIFELFTLLSALFVGTAIVMTTDSEHSLERYLMVAFALVACTELVALVEIGLDVHLPVSRFASRQVATQSLHFGSSRASAWFQNPNNLSFFLALAVGPLTATGLSARGDRSTGVRIGSLVAAGLAVVIIWADESRASLVAVVLTVAVVGAVIVIRPRLRPVTATVRGRLVAVSAALVGTGLWILLFFTTRAPFQPHRSLWIRWRTSRAGAEVFVHTDGLGAGVGNINTVIKSGATATHQIAPLNNWLLYFAAALGIVGAGLFMTVYGATLYDLGVTTINSTGPTAVGLFGMLLAFPLNGLGPTNAAMTHSFWVFLFFAIAAAYRIDGHERPGSRKRSTLRLGRASSSGISDRLSGRRP